MGVKTDLASESSGGVIASQTPGVNPPGLSLIVPSTVTVGYRHGQAVPYAGKILVKNLEFHDFYGQDFERGSLR